MSILIVESNSELASLWHGHLGRLGFEVSVSASQDDSVAKISEMFYNVIILNLTLANGSALAIADYVGFRWPDTRIIFVTNSSFFSDGSIFSHSANACAFIPQATAPEDLAAMVDYHAN